MFPLLYKAGKSTLLWSMEGSGNSSLWLLLSEMAQRHFGEILGLYRKQMFNLPWVSPCCRDGGNLYWEGADKLIQASRKTSQVNYTGKGESRFRKWESRFRKKIGNSLDVYIVDPEEFHFHYQKVVMNAQRAFETCLSVASV